MYEVTYVRTYTFVAAVYGHCESDVTLTKIRQQEERERPRNR